MGARLALKRVADRLVRLAAVPAAADVATALRTLWDNRGIKDTELALDRDGTIVPDSFARGSLTPALVDALPRSSPDGEPMIVLGAELGRGGMGVVHAGLQRSLGREVAIKSPRDDVRESATRSLLREARISGQLEHPNVVPVYDLYRDDRAPQLIMRKVEGREWSSVLDEQSLEANLRTLTQVCHAVHYAHTRGIVHLDLKPSNIMLGNYGEIYLLDWGIAVCTRDDLPEFLPRARDVSKVLGTPAYMAPELASGDGTSIDARTDVYLLGAMLHEILTGEPPHRGKTVFLAVVSAFESEPPEWPEDVSPELAAIATRAMARDPDDRYASAAEIREAIEDYLVHADSLALVAAAQDRFDRLITLLADDGDATEIDALAGEAEFGFRQALHVWPDNAAARTALQDLLERLIQRDLDRENWHGAKRRLRHLPQPRPDLEARAAEVEATASKLADELHRMRHDADIGMAGKRRAAIAYLGAVCWLLSVVGLGELYRLGVFVGHHWHMLATTTGGAVVFAGLIYRNREELFANAINRNAITMLSIGWVMGDLYWIGAWATGIEFQAAVVCVAPVTVFVIAGHAATVDRRLIPHTIVGTIGAICSIALPEWSVHILGLGGSVVLFMLARTWAKYPTTPHEPDSVAAKP